MRHCISRRPPSSPTGPSTPHAPVWRFALFCALMGCHFSESQQDGAPSLEGTPDMSADDTLNDPIDLPPSVGEMSATPDADQDQSACAPGAQERCDGLDNDCDGLIDETCPCAYKEHQAGVCASSVINELTGTCEPPPAFVSEEGPQQCDGLDNDCDGQTDERCHTPYQDVALGTHHVCRLDQDGVISCSGRASLNRLDAPPGEFTSIVAGDIHTCALDTAGAAHCWGLSSDDQSPPLDILFRQLVAQDGITCGLTRPDGSITCWGDLDEHGFKVPPTLLDKTGYTQLDISSQNGCVIDGDQKLTCWGKNAITSPPFDGEGYLAVSIEEGFGCGLRNDGVLHCWGTLPAGIEPRYQGRTRHFTTTTSTLVIIEDVRGRVEVHGKANESFDNTQIPLDETSGEPLEGITRAIFSPRHSCLLAEDGRLSCWGSNYMGQLVPLTRRDIEDVRIGDRHYCVSFLDGTHDCHGAWHPNGALDQGALNQQPHPSVQNVTDAGYALSCGINDQNLCLCWGNPLSSADDAEKTAITLFEPNMPLLDAVRCKDVQTHANHICLITEDDEVACAGFVEDGRSVPVNHTAPTKWLDVGRYDTCVVDLTDRVKCWGRHAESKNAALGSLPANTQIDAFAQSIHNVCLLIEGGELVCLGDSAHGIVNRAPQGEQHVLQLSMGNHHACILRQDRTAHCWGDDSQGQSSPPQNVQFLRIDVSHSNSCGVTVDHELICW